MKKNAIELTYIEEKEDGALSKDEVIEEYETSMEKIQAAFPNINEFNDIWGGIWTLINVYEERAYTQGFKNGFKFSKEID